VISIAELRKSKYLKEFCHEKTFLICYTVTKNFMKEYYFNNIINLKLLLLFNYTFFFIRNIFIRT